MPGRGKIIDRTIPAVPYSLRWKYEWKYQYPNLESVPGVTFDPSKMLMTMKAICWDEDRKVFCSPTHSDFKWPSPADVVMSECPTCARSEFVGHLDDKCHCGMYSSPNIPALYEYHKASNSIFVLAATFGDVDIWTSPTDVCQGNAYILRSWGLRIIGIVREVETRKLFLNGLAVDYFSSPEFSLDVWDLLDIEDLLEANFVQQEGITPFPEYDLCKAVDDYVRSHGGKA